MSFFHDHDDDDGGTIERTSSSHVHSCASRPENVEERSAPVRLGTNKRALSHTVLVFPNI